MFSLLRAPALNWCGHFFGALDDPIGAFNIALNRYESSAERKGMQFIRGMLNGIDQKDRLGANECIQRALQSPALAREAANLYTSVAVTAERVPVIVNSLRGGSLSAREVVVLSYGKGLDALKPLEFLPLFTELVDQHGAEACGPH